MSVYQRETVDNFVSAIDSVLNQSLPASEIILVKDGALYAELDNVIDAYMLEHKDVLKVVNSTENKGLGYALSVGVEACSYNVIARMDTDDICVAHRFERQIEFLESNPEYAVVGSNIQEFNNVPSDLGRYKVNPESHAELIKQIKLKSPFNHPSIFFKKDAVLNAGNYNGDLPLFEDYALFLRLWLNNAKFYNIQQPLLNFRVGTGIATIKRRSGFHYLKKEWRFILYAKKIGAFNYSDLIKYTLIKFPVRLLPPRFVLFIYNTFLRKKLTNR